MSPQNTASSAVSYVGNKAPYDESARMQSTRIRRVVLPQFVTSKRLIDRLVTPTIIKPMYVLNFGLSRTGTTSFRAALNQLGHKAYGMAEAGMSYHTQYWNEAIDAKFHGKGEPYDSDDFRKLLADFDVLTDVPVILFVDEMLLAYPEAKIVVTNRDVDSWLRSINGSIYVVMAWPSWWVLAPFDARGMGATLHCIWKCFDIHTRGDFWSREKLREAYFDHYNYVRKVVPNEKRLEFRSQDGWEPLCEFLGVDVPQGEYPRVNDSGEIVEVFGFLWKVLLSIAAMKILVYGGGIGALAGSIWWYQRRAR